MKTQLFSAAAALALMGTTALADGHLPFAPGEGAFTWDSFTAFAEANDFSGQTVTITGPWTGNEKEKFDGLIWAPMRTPMAQTKCMACSTASI